MVNKTAMLSGLGAACQDPPGGGLGNESMAHPSRPYGVLRRDLLDDAAACPEQPAYTRAARRLLYMSALEHMTEVVKGACGSARAEW